MSNPAYFPEPLENPNFVSRPPDPGSMKLYGTLAEDALYHSPISGVYRFSQLHQEKTGDFLNISRTIDPEEANRVYGLGGQLKFDEPIEEGAAQLMMRRKIAENDRNYTIGSGMTTGFRRVAGLGVGMAATLLDPVNTASMFVPVVGEAKFARMVQRFGGSFMKARLAAGAIEGTVGAAMVEPFVLLPAMQEQANYDIKDSAMNLAYGAGLGALLHAGFGAIGDRLRRPKAHERDAIFESAMNNVLKDEPVISPAKVTEFVAPKPEVRVTHMEMGGKTATQVDVIVPGEDRPIFSGTPEEAKAAGYDVPAEKETIRAAAVRFPDGRISEGKTHADIAMKEDISYSVNEETLQGVEDGFVTSSGRFVSREEALAIARGSEQVDMKVARNELMEFFSEKEVNAMSDEEVLKARPGLAAEMIKPDSLMSQHLEIPADRNINEIPRRDARGKFLSNAQRLDMLHAKIESERARAQSQDQIKDITTQENTSRLINNDLKVVSESDKVSNSINKEADELEQQILNRVGLEDDAKIEAEALKQQIKDEVGNPVKREAGVRAGIECIIKHLI